MSDTFSDLACSRHPADWLAAADWIEESGRPQDFHHPAHELRRMGEIALALLPPMARMTMSAARDTRRRTGRTVAAAGLEFVLERTPNQVRVRWDFRHLVWCFPVGAVACLLPDLGTNPPAAIDYDRPTMREWRYVRRRIGDIARVTKLLTEGVPS